MKKVLLLAVVLVLSINSCKKEEAGLPEFVIGNWKSQELTLWTQSEGVPSPEGCYTISIKTNGTYVLTFEQYPCGADKYTITGDQIYLSKFDMDPVWGDPPGPQTFSVTWLPGETQMIWTSIGGNAPELTWAKQ